MCHIEKGTFLQSSAPYSVSVHTQTHTGSSHRAAEGGLKQAAAASCELLFNPSSPPAYPSFRT